MRYFTDLFKKSAALLIAGLLLVNGTGLFSVMSFAEGETAQPDDGYVYVYWDDETGTTVVTGEEAREIAEESEENQQYNNLWASGAAAEWDVMDFTDYSPSSGDMVHDPWGVPSLIVGTFDVNKTTKYLLSKMLAATPAYGAVYIRIPELSSESIRAKFASAVYNCYNTYFPYNGGVTYSYKDQGGYTYLGIRPNLAADEPQRIAEERTAAKAYVTAHPFTYTDTDSERAYILAAEQYIDNRVTYGSDSHNGQFAYCALIEDKGVCNAYASALSWICFYAGIDAPKISGKSDKNSAASAHAWNLIAPSDGSPYKFADATWDDNYYPNSHPYFWLDYDAIGNRADLQLDKRVAYDYVLEFVDYVHGIDNSGYYPSGEVIPLPDDKPNDIALIPGSPDTDYTPVTSGTERTAPGYALTFEKWGGSSPLTLADYAGTNPASSRLVVWQNGGAVLTHAGTKIDMKSAQLKAYQTHVKASDGGATSYDFPTLLANAGFTFAAVGDKYYNVTTSPGFTWGVTDKSKTLADVLTLLKSAGKIQQTTGLPTVKAGKVTAGNGGENLSTLWFLRTGKPADYNNTTNKLTVLRENNLPLIGMATVMQKVAPYAVKAFSAPASTTAGDTATTKSVYLSDNVKLYGVGTFNLGYGSVSDPIFVAPMAKNVRDVQPTADSYSSYTISLDAKADNGRVAVLPAGTTVFTSEMFARNAVIHGDELTTKAIFILGGVAQYDNSRKLKASSAKVIIRSNQSGKSATVTAKIVNNAVSINPDNIRGVGYSSDEKALTYTVSSALLNASDKLKSAQTLSFKLYGGTNPVVGTNTGAPTTTAPTIFVTKTQPTAANWASFLNAKSVPTAPSGSKGALTAKLSSDKVSVIITLKKGLSISTATEYLVVAYGKNYEDALIVKIVYKK